MHFNGTKILPETITKTRQFFIDNCEKCKQNAINGIDRVNDLEKYILWKDAMISEYENGINDHTFTFLQRAYYIQTGETIAFLPK